MSKYTKGPWKINHHDHVNGDLWLTILGGSWDITHNGAKGAIADSHYSAMSEEENLANARLISAAPDMLEALQSVLERNDEYGGNIIGSDVEKEIKDAIAKALGEDAAELEKDK